MHDIVLKLTIFYIVCVATPICQSGMKTEELSCSAVTLQSRKYIVFSHGLIYYPYLYYRVINKLKTKCEKYLKPMPTNTFLTRKNNQALHLKQ